MRALFRYSIIGMVLVMVGCQTSQRKDAEQVIVPTEKVASLGEQLDRNILLAYGHWQDAVAMRLLDRMVARLVESDPAYVSLGETKVVLLETGTSYIAPGMSNSIYVSRGMLGVFNYENELAFALATQIVLLKDEATKKNLANLQGQEVGESLILLPTTPAAIQRNYLGKGWFEPGGLFDFGSLAYLKAEQEAIRLVHAAGFDPRGAVTYVQQWGSESGESGLKPLGKILPDPRERLMSAREEVAKLSPLRDPIVKSRAFEELQSRLQIKKAKTKRKRATK